MLWINIYFLFYFKYNIIKLGEDMKKTFQFIELIFVLFIFAMVVTYRVEIHSFIVDNIIYHKETYVSTPNEYAKDYSFEYVKITDNFVATNKQQILDIFYTYLNNGEENFYFYCDYDECIKDVRLLTNQNYFANINNFVHPYNTYNKLYISSNSWGKIKLTITKTYSNNEINIVNDKIDSIISKIIEDDMTDKEKIKAFHDYVINNSRYDVDYIDQNLNDLNHSSHKASGNLVYSKALCGGYTHTMSIFLDILKIPNYRISSDTHIWNYVYLDGNWYHLDLTWDDPVTSNKKDVLLDKYFLISTSKLESFNTGVHDFDENVFIEANRTFLK